MPTPVEPAIAALELEELAQKLADSSDLALDDRLLAYAIQHPRALEVNLLPAIETWLDHLLSTLTPQEFVNSHPYPLVAYLSLSNSSAHLLPITSALAKRNLLDCIPRAPRPDSADYWAGLMSLVRTLVPAPHQLEQWQSFFLTSQFVNRIGADISIDDSVEFLIDLFQNTAPMTMGDIFVRLAPLHPRVRLWAQGLVPKPGREEWIVRTLLWTPQTAPQTAKEILSSLTGWPQEVRLLLQSYPYTDDRTQCSIRNVVKNVIKHMHPSLLVNALPLEPPLCPYLATRLARRYTAVLPSLSAYEIHLLARQTAHIEGGDRLPWLRALAQSCYAQSRPEDLLQMLSIMALSTRELAAVLSLAPVTFRAKVMSLIALRNPGNATPAVRVL